MNQQRLIMEYVKNQLRLQKVGGGRLYRTLSSGWPPETWM